VDPPAANIASGQGTRRARCGESRTPGSAGGPEKPTGSNPGRALRPDPTHLRHKSNGGETSVRNCALLCGFHHDICIHRWGWQFTLHPDGTTEARSPDGKTALHSHAPPLANSA